MLEFILIILSIILVGCCIMSIVYIEIVGKSCIDFLFVIGNASVFILRSLYHCFVPPCYFYNIMKHIIEIGFFSLPIIGLTGFFIGAVIVLQSCQMIALNPTILTYLEQVIPKIVTVSVIRELGPVFVGLIMIGKAGSSIAAEIGTMRITEQIDALKTLDTNTFKYLISPRILASIIAFPILTICAGLAGIFGGYITAMLQFGHSLDKYIKYTIQSFYIGDWIMGLIKSAVFGAVISLVSCYYGYNCQEGARGVGIVVTSTAVLSSILIILINYIITLIYA